MKRRPSRRIQTTIAAAFAVVVLATALVLSVLSYSFTQEEVQRAARDHTAQLIGQIQTNIDSYIDHMKNIADVVNANEQLQNVLRRDQSAAGDDDDEETAIQGFLHSISQTRKDISLILIAGANGVVLAHEPTLRINESVNMQTQRWHAAALAQRGRAVVSSSHVQNIIDGEYRWVITLSRTVDDTETGAPLGVLLVDLNFSVINDLVTEISLGSGGYLFIVDREGRIVYHPRQELIYSDLEHEYIDRVLSRSDGTFTVRDEKGERLYTVRTSDSTGWRTVGVNYSGEMVQNPSRIRRTYALGALLCGLASVGISILISHRISRPILELRASMRAVERGDFDIDISPSSNNEIGDLERDFAIMITQIKELMRRNEEEHQQKRKSELLALQNQITPHFLYNTLDSVIWMAEGKQYANVVHTVSALARLLRLSISKGDELVTIRDEIEHITNYLTIQKVRYRDRLDFEIDVDESILALSTPKVILQPLVENAIYHGIKNTESGGCVAVLGRRRNGTVILAVQDDGVGMDDARMAKLLDPETELDGRDPADPRDGYARHRVGVRNVHERVQLYFGTEYGLSFQHNNGSGLIVEVRLPVVGGNGTTS